MAKIEDCPGFETFGSDVKAAREALNISRRALAEQVSIDPRYLANIELEQTVSSVPVVLQLIRICKLPVERYFNPSLIADNTEQRQRVNHKLQLCPEKYLPIIEEKQDMFLFLTMLFPFFPDDALCMLAGLTKISLGRFVAIMALARPWGLIVAALLGSGSLSLPVWAWAVIGGAGLLIFVFAMKYSAQIEEALLGLVRRIVPKRNRSDRN